MCRVPWVSLLYTRTIKAPNNHKPALGLFKKSSFLNEWALFSLSPTKTRFLRFDHYNTDGHSKRDHGSTEIDNKTQMECIFHPPIHFKTNIRLSNVLFSLGLVTRRIRGDTRLIFSRNFFISNRLFSRLTFLKIIVDHDGRHTLFFRLKRKDSVFACSCYIEIANLRLIRSLNKYAIFQVYPSDWNQL